MSDKVSLLLKNCRYLKYIYFPDLNSTKILSKVLTRVLKNNYY